MKYYTVYFLLCIFFIIRLFLLLLLSLICITDWSSFALEMVAYVLVLKIKMENNWSSPALPSHPKVAKSYSVVNETHYGILHFTPIPFFFSLLLFSFPFPPLNFKRAFFSVIPWKFHLAHIDFLNLLF
ncbi:unnamed protein product [Citrullus colocynthis]|uniref:Uncharacterized protein n=1 Tax=Citrullus colocynthis TaxID=252529 RepID=A0ABP0YED5_9ROSI